MNVPVADITIKGLSDESSVKVGGKLLVESQVSSRTPSEPISDGARTSLKACAREKRLFELLQFE